MNKTFIAKFAHSHHLSCSKCLVFRICETLYFPFSSVSSVILFLNSKIQGQDEELHKICIHKFSGILSTNLIKEEFPCS